jgi:hypothetical protein
MLRYYYYCIVYELQALPDWKMAHAVAGAVSETASINGQQAILQRAPINHAFLRFH